MLTATECRNAKSKDRPYKLTDIKGLYLEVKPNGVKAWRYRFELCRDGERKESVFAIGDYATAPTGETEQQAKARRAGGGFTLAEARDERAKARAWYGRVSTRHANAGSTGSNRNGRAQLPSRPWRPSGWRSRTGRK
jgi:hypothetical protein